MNERGVNTDMQGNWEALSSLKIKYKCYKYD